MEMPEEMMNTKSLTVVASIKAAAESGIIEGYGSVWDVVDSYGDKVVPGAFERTLKEARATGRMPAMLWQHDPSAPIGVWQEMNEDKTGLHVRGKLADTQRGREAYELVKLGALTGLSIGYMVKGYSYDDRSGITTLTDLDLWEVSPVTFPANTEARITGVKAADQIQSVRDFEQFLRDAGFSRKDAERIAAYGFKAQQGEPAASSAKQGEPATRELVQLLTRLKVPL